MKKGAGGGQESLQQCTGSLLEYIQRERGQQVTGRDNLSSATAVSVVAFLLENFFSAVTDSPVMAGASNSHAIRSLMAHYDSDSEGSSDASNMDESANNVLSQGEVKMSVDTTSPVRSRSPLPLNTDLNPVSNDVQELNTKSSNCKILNDEDEFEHKDETSEDIPSDPIAFHRTLIGLRMDQIKIPKEPQGTPDREVIEKLGKLRDRKDNKKMDMKYEIQRRKDFRNPSIYEKLIDHCGINEFGSNFPPEIFDPAGFSENSFFDRLSNAQKILMDKLSEESNHQANEKNITSKTLTVAPSVNKATIEIVTGTAKRPASFVATSSTSSSSSNANHSSSSSSSSSSSKRKRRSKWDEGPGVRTSTSNKV